MQRPSGPLNGSPVSSSTLNKATGYKELPHNGTNPTAPIVLSIFTVRNNLKKHFYVKKKKTNRLKSSDDKSNKKIIKVILNYQDSNSLPSHHKIPLFASRRIYPRKVSISGV